MQGSGYTLSEVVDLNIQISRFDVIAGSSYIDLPDFLKSKKAIINVQNNDSQCFKYAVLSALYPPKTHSNRVSSYEPYMNSLDFTNIKFPVELKQITKFEDQNPTIAINVYMYEKEEKRRFIKYI